MLLIISDTIAPVFATGIKAGVTAEASEWDKLSFTLSASNFELPPIQGHIIRLHYGFANQLFSENIPTSVVPAGHVDFILPGTANEGKTTVVPNIEVGGPYLYFWLDVPEGFGQPVYFEVSISQYASGDSGVLFGNGSPDGVVVSAPGRFYFDQDNADGYPLWFKLGNNPNNGWRQLNIQMLT